MPGRGGLLATAIGSYTIYPRRRKD